MVSLLRAGVGGCIAFVGGGVAQATNGRGRYPSPAGRDAAVPFWGGGRRQMERERHDGTGCDASDATSGHDFQVR